MIAKRLLLRFSAVSGVLLGLPYLLILLVVWGLPKIGWQITLGHPLTWRQVWAWGLPTLYVVMILLFVTGQLLLAVIRNRRFARDAVTYHIMPRADAPSGGCETGRQFWNQVSDMLPRGEHVVMGLSTMPDQSLQFSLTARPKSAERIVHQLLADWPGAQVRKQTKQSGEPSAASITVSIMLATQSTAKPLITQVQDPLYAPLVELSRLPSHAQAGVQVQARRDLWTQKSQLRTAQQQAIQKPSTQTERQADRASDERAAHPFLETRIVVWATATNKEEATRIARSLAQDVSAQFSISNPLISQQERNRTPSMRFPAFAGQPLTDKELGSLMHLLGKEGVQLAPLLATATARNLEPSQACRISNTARLIIRTGAI